MNKTKKDGARIVKALSAEATGADLSLADRAWASGIAELTKIKVSDAYMRIRRIRYDARIQERMQRITEELGPNMLVTNIEWSGPTMSDLEVSVMPIPPEVILKQRLSDLRQYTPNDRAQAARYAAAVMRSDVARFELRKVYGHAKTSLGDLGAIACGVDW